MLGEGLTEIISYSNYNVGGLEVNKLDPLADHLIIYIKTPTEIVLFLLVSAN